MNEEDIDLLDDLIKRNGMSGVLLQIADHLDALRYKGQAEIVSEVSATVDDSDFA